MDEDDSNDYEIKWATLLTGDQETISKFIKLVKANPSLYGNLQRRQKVEEWKSVARVTSMTVDQVMQRWKRLRDKYRTELKKELAAPREYLSSWKFYQEMSFLREIEYAKMRPKAHFAKITAVSSPKRAKKSHDATPCPSMASQTEPAELLEVPILKQATINARSEIEADLQQQARIDVIRRTYRNPVPDPSGGTINIGQDMDYEFLLMRVYPYLTAIPRASKLAVYERLQQYMHDLFVIERAVCPE